MINYRLATKEDVNIYFDWVNDREVRNNAINNAEIFFDDHSRWFEKKIIDPDTIMLIFSEGNENIGQLRIDLLEREGVISYSIVKEHRSKGHGTNMLMQAADYYFLHSNVAPLIGLVKVNNGASLKAFTKSGFEELEEKVNINGELYLKFSKNG